MPQVRKSITYAMDEVATIMIAHVKKEMKIKPDDKVNIQARVNPDKGIDIIIVEEGGAVSLGDSSLLLGGRKSARVFTKEEKKEVVKEVLNGGNVAVIARRIAVTPGAIYGWKKQHGDEVRAEMEDDG